MWSRIKFLRLYATSKRSALVALPYSPCCCLRVYVYVCKWQRSVISVVACTQSVVWMDQLSPTLSLLTFLNSSLIKKKQQQLHVYYTPLSHRNDDNNNTTKKHFLFCCTCQTNHSHTITITIWYFAEAGPTILNFHFAPFFLVLLSALLSVVCYASVVYINFFSEVSLTAVTRFRVFRVKCTATVAIFPFYFSF